MYALQDIREIQTSIRDSLGPPTAAFCLELWKLCLSAQQDPNGVPKELLEAKKLEVKQQKVRRGCRGLIFPSLCM
jgi:hypothetical protein